MNYEEIFFDDTKNSKKIKKEYYLVEGKYPIIDQGKENIAGYFNEETGIYKSTNPVIIFGDHTRIIKYIDFPFFLGADGVKILKVKNEKFLVKYLYYALLKFKIPNTGYNRHFKWLKNFKIEEIELEKQKKIVEILDKSNLIIKKKKEELKKLEKLKKSLFYEMFGDPIRNEKGWEVKKLSEVSDVFIGITYKPEEVSEEGIFILRSGNIHNSILTLKDELKIKKNINTKYFVKKNDILMCSRNGSSKLVGKVALIDKDYINMSFGAFMTIIRSQHYNYLYHYFKTEYFRNSKIFRKTTTINQITKKELENILLILPPLELQNKFAEKVEKIDKLKFTEISSNKSCILLRKTVK